MKLSPVLQIILDEVSKGPASSLDLMYAIWGTQDGPSWPYNSLRSHVTLLNRRLAPEGLRVVKSHNGRAGQDTTPYRLISVPPSFPNIEKPRKPKSTRETRRIARIRKINPAWTHTG